MFLLANTKTQGRHASLPSERAFGALGEKRQAGCSAHSRLQGLETLAYSSGLSGIAHAQVFPVSGISILHGGTQEFFVSYTSSIVGEVVVLAR